MECGIASTHSFRFLSPMRRPGNPSVGSSEAGQRNVGDDAPHTLPPSVGRECPGSTVVDDVVGGEWVRGGTPPLSHVRAPAGDAGPCDPSLACLRPRLRAAKGNGAGRVAPG